MRNTNLLQYNQEKIDLEKKRYLIYKEIADLRKDGEDNFSGVLNQLLNQKGLLDKQIENLEQEMAEEDSGFNSPVAEYILNMDDEVRVIKIVDPHTANPNIGLISYNSPLASALIKAEGEEIIIKTPRGSKVYRILARISNA
jgi:transcription elongation GreA/GreB family factor